MNLTFTLTHPTLPARLRMIRETLGLSREQLASCLTKRAPGNNVGRIERGVHNPSPRTLVRLARGLGVSVKFLVDGYPGDSGVSPMGWKVDEGFPARLRRSLRDQAVLPDELVARLAHGSTGTVLPVLKGTIQPRPETVVNIAKALGVSAQYLATGVANPVPFNKLTSGQRLMLFRHASQLTRSELASEAGIEDSRGHLGWQNLRFWEAGKYRPPFKEFEQVASTLGVTLNALMADEEPQEQETLWKREQRLPVSQQKILEDMRFMFETGALTIGDASEFTQFLRKQLMRRLTKSVAAA